MPRPRKLKVGLYTYPVRWVRRCVPPDGEEEVNGYITRRRGDHHIAIGIAPDQTSDEREVVLHEVMHALVADRALDRLFASTDDEEMFVTSLSMGLLAALCDNKGLADYLVSHA